MQIYNEYHKKALFLRLKNVNQRKFCSQHRMSTYKCHCHGTVSVSKFQSFKMKIENEFRKIVILL